MIKFTSVSFLGVLLAVLMVSCGGLKETTTERKNFKTNVSIFFSPAYMSGARPFIPMTKTKIQKEQRKNIQSNRLSKIVNSIIKQDCLGGSPVDNMMILIKNDHGSFGIHQNKTVTINNRVCSVTYKMIDEVIILAGLQVQFAKMEKN